VSKIRKILVKTRTDMELLEGMRKGENSAIADIYKTCYPSVSHMILNNKGTEDEAKDIFQEAMIVLYDKITQAEGFELSSKLNTFLYAICRRLWLKQLNRRNLSLDSIDHENLDIPDMDSALESHEAEEVKFNQMEAAMANLGEPCASILKEFYIKKKSMQEICDQLGYTNADNAKNQKYKCLQRLKKLFFDQWVKDER